ncbi:MAG: PEP-CTERM sorting domain-containing protein [Terriglobales bacterium]
MKISQICAVALLLVVGSVMAFADGINDPKIIIHGVGGAASASSCTNCDVGLNFKFTVPESGKGTLFFTNTSGQNWTSLMLIEPKQPHQVLAGAISCGSNLFSSCTTKTLTNGSVEILLAGAKCGGGIANGQSFSIKFACVRSSCWPGGLDFSAHANRTTVPEPGTIALMVTGLGALVSRRKLWKNRLKA